MVRLYGDLDFCAAIAMGSIIIINVLSLSY